MVFAPAPLLTVTIEQQGDVPELHLHPGGQGVWQTRMIAALGVPVTMCVGLGGEVGDAVRKLLDDEDVTVRTVRRESGTGWYVHDRRDGERTEIAEHPGAPMVRHDIDELYTVTLTEGLRAPVSVLSGPATRRWWTRTSTAGSPPTWAPTAARWWPTCPGRTWRRCSTAA